jgi:excisionase family DNA binding protein
VKGNGGGEARKFYSTAEVPEKLGLTRRTMQKWPKDGRLPHNRFGQGKGATYRIVEEDLEAFLQLHRQGRLQAF